MYTDQPCWWGPPKRPIISLEKPCVCKFYLSFLLSNPDEVTLTIKLTLKLCFLSSLFSLEYGYVPVNSPSILLFQWRAVIHTCKMLSDQTLNIDTEKPETGEVSCKAFRRLLTWLRLACSKISCSTARSQIKRTSQSAGVFGAGNNHVLSDLYIKCVLCSTYNKETVSNV